MAHSDKPATIPQSHTEGDTIVRGNVFQRWWIIVRDGFRNMTWGRPLVWLILIKLFVMFAILKVFFFPNFLSSKGDTEEEQQEYVVEQFVERSQS
jgi:hypothetical protein